MMPYHYIAIEGCIGAGKTELAKKLSQDFQAGLLLERFAENPFLPKFYQDPVHYAFPVEISFLEDRYEQLHTLQKEHFFDTNLIFADYFIDKCLIFAKNNLDTLEYDLYIKMFNIITGLLPKPDLILYLYNTPEALLANISKRGREYEKGIETTYLDNIQNSYLSFFESYSDTPVIIAGVSSLDFMHSDDDYARIKGLLEGIYSNEIHRITLK